MELARVVHDSVAQTLSAMLLDLDEFRFSYQGQDGVDSHVDRMERSTRRAQAELRDLLGDLRARHQSDRDLVKLVKRGIRSRRPTKPDVKFELVVTMGWPERIPGGTATELQRIIAEAIENAIRHGGAKSISVSFSMMRGARNGQVVIQDDGRGLPDNKVPRSGGLGILGMRERALLLGGRVRISSLSGGQGTAVHVIVPATALDSAPRSSSTSVAESPHRAIS
jgi:signal transduction histidine kinase